jgi:hypothetical protein
MCLNGMSFSAEEMEYTLPNVEPPGFEVLGSIPVEVDGLLANAELTPLGDSSEQRVFLGPQGVDLEQLLPSLGIPQSLPAK